MGKGANKNWRQWENTLGREAYRETHPVDEIAYLFPPLGTCEVRIPWPQPMIISRDNEPAIEIHHVAAGISGNRRWDRPWNLCALSKWTHFFVNRFRFDGIVLCVFAKAVKGEFDWVESREKLGLSLWGHCHKREAEWDFVKPIQERLLKMKGAA